MTNFIDNIYQEMEATFLLQKIRTLFRILCDTFISPYNKITTVNFLYQLQFVGDLLFLN